MSAQSIPASTPASVHLTSTSRKLMIGLIVALSSIVGWAFFRKPVREAASHALPSAATSPEAPPSEPKSDLITLPRETWTAAGVELAQPKQRPLNETIHVTGKVTLNQDRVAHIYPLMAGRVESVQARLGQKVKSGEQLLTIESPEIGTAKLDLYRSRLLSQFAAKKDEWTQEVARNTQSLVNALQQSPSMDELDQQFRELKLGKNRQELITAYANLRKSNADYDRLNELSRQGIAAGKQLIAAQTEHDANAVTFQALLETSEQEEYYAALLSAHARQEAESQVAVNEATLKILGFDARDLEQIDPIKEGRALSCYSIRAPFDGTIISKDVVLMERVSLDQQLLTVADLSTVWVQADLYEQHLPLLENLNGKEITVKSAAWPDQPATARVFHTGEIVNETSRTTALRALAENPAGRLKPGMFVEIDLTSDSPQPVIIVPVTAIQEYQGKQFVFISRGDDKFERRDVITGRRNGEDQEVLSGLSTSDTIATQGGFAIKSQMLADLLSGD
ncbi:efflux RND transporter periplasmic adaptor subunit [Planctomicrobium sp. SH664]|uniref:efflux RND transporter periplasmic adaptor subunit n=1 Tax=Planctomicrobium sp. SH664 TaxID=3448125 RepID=UPI003F5C8FE4